jgi:hypothetical protein
MCHEEHTASRGTTDCDLAILHLGVIRIRERKRQGVEEDRRGLLEPNEMLLEVRGDLDRIPLVDYEG